MTSEVQTWQFLNLFGLILELRYDSYIKTLSKFQTLKDYKNLFRGLLAIQYLPLSAIWQIQYLVARQKLDW